MVGLEEVDAFHAEAVAGIAEEEDGLGVEFVGEEELGEEGFGEWLGGLGI